MSLSMPLGPRPPLSVVVVRHAIEAEVAPRRRETRSMFGIEVRIALAVGKLIDLGSARRPVNRKTRAAGLGGG
jgi:hypothetical protein